MELMNSTTDRKWKNGTLWTFIGCLVLLLILDHQTNQNSSLSALLIASRSSTIRKNTLPLAPIKPSDNITIDQTTAISPITIANDHVTSNFTKQTVLHVTRNFTAQAPTQTTTTTRTTKKKCNIFEGRWVYDPEQYPSYDATSCPFYDPILSCRKNGRPDTNYLKWRWEATGCDIPLFNGTDMLERLRNKRVIIVGDSLNRNQWESLACLLYSSISDPSRVHVDAEASVKVLKAKDYNCTVEFYMIPFLVELNTAHKSGRKVLVLDKISSSARKWLKADVMVFNSWHWWTHPDTIKGWDLFEYKGQIIEQMSREVAFERGMKTWAKWIKSNVDPKKTTILFRTTSPTHHGKNSCVNSTQPFMDESFDDSHNPKLLIEVFDKVIKGMSKLQVKYLNITKLSQYRKDAHPSMYTSLQWKDAPKPIMDCSHWCLPGLPDTWNRLLYASLFFDTSGNDMSST